MTKIATWKNILHVVKEGTPHHPPLICWMTFFLSWGEGGVSLGKMSWSACVVIIKLFFGHFVIFGKNSWPQILEKALMTIGSLGSSFQYIGSVTTGIHRHSILFIFPFLFHFLLNFSLFFLYFITFFHFFRSSKNFASLVMP